MSATPIVTLTTDFGVQDWFVGTMKGVIARIAPQAKVVDICHEIPPGDIRSGGFVLAAGCRYFPKDTIHVAVVDPGVGSTRQAVAVSTTNYIFVAPDNGLLSPALKGERVESIHVLENREFFLPAISSTFHGRDIFAPVAAHLAGGISTERLGRLKRDIVRMEWPKSVRKGEQIAGEVLYIDRFGNGITNIENSVLTGCEVAACEVGTGRHSFRFPVGSHYGAVPTNESVAVRGSTGYLEIGINGGSAQRVLNIQVGSTVLVRCHFRKRRPMQKPGLPKPIPAD